MIKRIGFFYIDGNKTKNYEMQNKVMCKRRDCLLI